MTRTFTVEESDHVADAHRPPGAGEQLRQLHPAQVGQSLEPRRARTGKVRSSSSIRLGRDFEAVRIIRNDIRKRVQDVVKDLLA